MVGSSATNKSEAKFIQPEYVKPDKNPEQEVGFLFPSLEAGI